MGFLDYLNDVEKEHVAMAKKPVVLPKRPLPVVESKKPAPVVVEESDDLDEYLVENEWKFRNSIWVDPITKNRLSYDAAYAVQQERDRVGALMVETKQVPRAGGIPVGQMKQQPAVSVMDYAASVLSEDGETLYENDSVAQSAMYSGKFSTPVVGDVPQASPTEAFYGSEEARMLAEAEAQAFADGASMSGVPSRTSMNHNGGMMSHASALF